ncbi:MAG: hypothetical protein P4M00_05850 [Azospirillaceae bacterium]|nr:hypothetical protein [Azospirillaceae bacterium]
MISVPTLDTRFGDLASDDPEAVERLASFHPVFALHHDRALANATLSELADRVGLPIEAVLAVAGGELHTPNCHCQGGGGCLD